MASGIALTRTISAAGPTVDCEIESKRGVAASYPLFVGSYDENGEFVGDDLTSVDAKLELWAAGTPNNPTGSPAYTFDSTGSNFTKDVASSSFTLTWTAAESAALAAGTYVFRFSLLASAAVTDRPIQGYWFHR